MSSLISLSRFLIAPLILLLVSAAVIAQRAAVSSSRDSEFGPVVTAYLGY